MNISRLVRQEIADPLHYSARCVGNRASHLVGEEAEDIVDDVVVRTPVLKKERCQYEVILEEITKLWEEVVVVHAAYVMIMRMTKFLKLVRVRAGSMVVSIAAVVVVVVFIVMRISSIIHQEPCILLVRRHAAARMVLTSLFAIPLNIHGLYFRILELANFDTVAAIGVCDWTGRGYGSQEDDEDLGTHIL